MATTDTSNSTLTPFRVAMLEELGFSASEAEALSNSFYDVSVKDPKSGLSRIYRIRVDHHYVRRMLNAGATPEQVLAICV